MILDCFRSQETIWVVTLSLSANAVAFIRFIDIKTHEKKPIKAKIFLLVFEERTLLCFH